MSWTKQVTDRINQIPVRGGRSEKLIKIDFSNLVFLPAQINKRPIDYFKEPIASTTILGKNSAHPIEIKVPILIAAMSFGALSRSAKLLSQKRLPSQVLSLILAKGECCPKNANLLKI